MAYFIEEVSSLTLEKILQSPKNKWKTIGKKFEEEVLKLDNRETRKKFVVYCLIDGTIRVANFTMFINSIFFIGRSYDKYPPVTDLELAYKLKEDTKTVIDERILEIWETGNRVVILKITEELDEIPSRILEGALIELIGQTRLTNVIGPQYYETPAEAWSANSRKELGFCIVYKSYKKYIEQELEQEQYSESDIKRMIEGNREEDVQQTSSHNSNLKHPKNQEQTSSEHSHPYKQKLRTPRTLKSKNG